ncbi:MAG: HEAT repeat domain-containing protein [Nitrospira sp. NTP1]|nr:HEAT repeat domain-containing protein [Nitrospira sp. NTP1]
MPEIGGSMWRKSVSPCWADVHALGAEGGAADSTCNPLHVACTRHSKIHMSPVCFPSHAPYRACLLPLVLFFALTGCYVEVPPDAPPSVSIRLSELLADPDPEVRRTAAEALGKIGHQSAESALLAALADQDPRVRAAAALALGRVSDGKSGAVLVRKLADPSESVRVASALALGEIDHSAAHEEQILHALHDADASTRVAASRALLRLETVSFSTDLESALKDPNPQVRQGVAAVLSETGDTRSLPSLLRLLQHDADAGVRAEAAFRLGKVGDAAVLDVLSAVAERDANPRVREWAHWAIRQITTQPGTDSENRRGQ